MLADGILRSALHIAAERSIMDARYAENASEELFEKLGFVKNKEEKQLDIELTESAKDYVIESGFDPIYGARPLKRFLQSRVETLLARKIISSELSMGTVLTVDYDGKELYIKNV